jgi:hypothetical protein
MILIRQAGETAWRAPATNSYTDERALQDLIARSPTLIPGTANTPIAVVRELPVPGIGYIDVVGVDPNGDITVIECKLKANPEIRRQIVGQVLAYAAGLWGISYEAFDAAFAAVAHPQPDHPIDGVTEPERTQRESVDDVQHLVERLLPDEGCRHAVLQGLADAIDAAHGVGSNRWAVTINRQEIRLNVGSYVAYAIMREGDH